MRTDALEDLEIWKSVVGWEGRYEVSSVGNLRSLSARGGPRRTPRVCRLQSHGQYYYSYVLKDRPAGRIVKAYLHRLVLEAFIGPCPVGFVCDHIDGNGYNNVVSNLRWISQRDNQRRRSGTGGFACGPGGHYDWRHGLKSTTTPEQWRLYQELKTKREEIRNGTSACYS